MYRVIPDLQVRMVLALGLVACPACAGPAAPPPITDATFWNVLVTWSEAPRPFSQSDNLVSNEPLYAEFARLIRRRGGAYVGVGPEQNFSYIARLEPAVAFIVDIRRDNRNLHLMYKALFEMATDRASFLSLLFSRPPPSGTAAGEASVEELFELLDTHEADIDLLEGTRRAIRDRLVGIHQFPLDEEDLVSIDAALRAFFADGPAIRYGRSQPPSRFRPSYRTLMTIRDLWGNSQSYLASEAAFAVVKSLHLANRIVPLVGDFAGQHTIRRIASYLQTEGHTLAAFYGSNVEVYLTRDERRTFCSNLETLPYDAGTHFIGNRRLLTLPDKLQACARIQPSLPFPDLGTAR